MLKTADGVTWAWLAEQTLPTYDADDLPGGVEQTTTTFRIGNMLVQTGSASAPGPDTSNKTSVAVTFGEAFDSMKGKASIDGASNR